MILHLVSLPHTQTTSEYLTCAYTQKVVRACEMFRRRGHEVVLYAGEENEAVVAEHVQLVSERTRRRHFGKAFDTVHTPLEWDGNAPYWRGHNRAAVREIRKRIGERDLILLTTGTQAPIARALPQISCEWTVGYEGIETKFCAFESSAWRHHVYGLKGWRNGRYFDATIPSFFDVDEFELGDKKDYLLFVGRLVARKGPHVAAEIAERVGMPLVLCGPGALEHGLGFVRYEGGAVGGNVAYAGVLDRESRARLMAGARALLVPTQYLEPFGNVAIEAMLSGTPAVASDFGAFVETVDEGVTGYRFSTLKTAARAVELALELDPATIRARAVERFSLEAVGARFDDWFEQLDSVHDEGWYA